MQRTLRGRPDHGGTPGHERVHRETHQRGHQVGESVVAPLGEAVRHRDVNDCIGTTLLSFLYLQHFLPAVVPCDHSPFPLSFDASEDAAVRLGKGLTGHEVAEYPLDLEAFHAVVSDHEVEFAPQLSAQAAGVGRECCPAQLLSRRSACWYSW